LKAGQTWDEDGAMAKKTTNLRIRVILALLTCWLGVAAFSAYADESDWVRGSTLRQLRESHTALLVDLPGGLSGVMVIGGFRIETTPEGLLKPSPVKSTELYYPKDHTWNPGPSLTTSRLANTATLLTRTTGPNKGKVLVAGGLNVASISTCELLDPKSQNKVEAPDNMTVARHNHVAIELENGKVLVAGGEHYNAGNDTILDSYEIYDPNTNTWTDTKKLNHRRSKSTAVLLKKDPNKGKVLVVGGFDMVKFPDKAPIYLELASCELYDPVNDVWDNATSLNYPRGSHTLTLLDDGRVLAAGGVDDGGNVTRTYEIYDPDKKTWTCPWIKDNKKHLRHSRSGHTATLLPGGKVLLVSGYTGEIYDPKTDSWTFTRDTLWYPRQAHTATLLRHPDIVNYEVIVAGGGANVCEKYVPPIGSASLNSGVDRSDYPEDGESVSR
jgi:hypothetical protein